jgi:hypothetical protein
MFPNGKVTFEGVDPWFPEQFGTLDYLPLSAVVL